MQSRIMEYDMKKIFHDVTGSVNSKRAHPSSPGICGAFIYIFFRTNAIALR